nr:MAG TPA: hypothetical protein [Caudoviricetes sp.]
MTKIIVLNYATSEVDIIDFTEINTSIEDWINQNYNESEIYYMVSDNLSINFINSNNI